MLSAAGLTRARLGKIGMAAREEVVANFNAATQFGTLADIVEKECR